MTDYIGAIAVPEIVPSGVFPVIGDYGYGRAHQPEVAIHRFGSANSKIEQRMLLGTGAKRFTVRKSAMNEADREALRDFWESCYGPYGAFTYNVPNDDGNGTTAYICRFANEPLSWEMLSDAISSVGITLIEIPASSPTYSLNSTNQRFPSAALEAALLSPVQEIIPLVKIQPRESGYPAIYVSDRRCTVGGQIYQARLLEADGIRQSIGNEADQAEFTFGNADRVMRDLANDVDLNRAAIEFSLFHVGTGIKLNLFKGEIIDWILDSGPEFAVTAADGIYELTLPYPTRRILRTCWKCFDDGNGCPYAAQSSGMDYVHFPDADPTKCDKGYDTANGCLAHGMKCYFGGIIAEPQGVRTKDNSKGTFGYGRPTLTSSSIVQDSIYDEVIPEIYTNAEAYEDSDGEIHLGRPINCKIAAGREEGDFYEALGIVGEGPITFGSKHTLDGSYHHGYPGSLGLRTLPGTDPAGATDFFSLDEAGDSTGGDFRKAYSGGRTYKDNFAAGTAALAIRRNDETGVQLTYPGSHEMKAIVLYGLQGWVWTASGSRSMQTLSNPIWIAVNMMLRARGLRFADAATAEQYFDVDAAIAAAAICDELVTPLIGDNPTETQFKFQGVIQEEKPLRDWIQEVLMNCLGYYSFAFGKLKLGIRTNSSVVEAFTEGNILFKSLSLSPLKPEFNHLTANFADAEFAFAANSVAVYDVDHGKLIGGATAPLFLKSQMNLSGVSHKSQAARVISVRLREELGGITADQWKAARKISFQTTVLALNVEPGMVCSMTHDDMPAGDFNGVPTEHYGEFRVTGWKLNKDYSIDIEGRTTVDDMYDLVDGPKPADVAASPVPTESHILIGGPPDQLSAKGLISGDKILFTCLAKKWNQDIYEAEFRAVLVPAGQSVDSVDLRTEAEGGTFAHNGTTQLVLTGLFANWQGVHYQHFFGTNVGRWYFAFRLRNTSAGWSAWTDGNRFPQQVFDYVDTDDAYSDTGPAADFTVSIKAGAQSGTALVVVSRPQTYGKRIWFVEFQIRDARSGSWRNVDANSGAAVTHYDGSAISHTYDPVAGTITKASGDYGDGATYGGLMLVDRRQGQFDQQHCTWIWVDPSQISGSTISKVIGAEGISEPDENGQYADLRIKIVKTPKWWNNSDPANSDGYCAEQGMQDQQHWENDTCGDLASPTFTSLPFILPSGVSLEDIQARVWFGTDYSFSDGGINSGNGPVESATPPDAGVVQIPAAATITLDCGLGSIFYIDLDQDATLANFVNCRHGRPVIVIVRQDATGGHTLSLDTKFNYGSEITETAVVIAPEPGARSYFGFIYDSDADLIDVVAFVSGYQESA